jgi:quercetin dioxygenase-like cupin family protein/alkylhydroperoxidase/carboxymuconolactone decarboxylase family protein YurZ
MRIKLTMATAVALSTCLSVACATETPAIVVTRAGSQPSEAGPAKHFSGSVRVDSRFQAPAPARVGGGIVTFEPGARTNWHTHPLGQTLIVTAGVGRVQKWGDPVLEIRPGDVVWIPPGVKHWHGASPTTAMTHIAISEQLDGKGVDWQEKVSDAQFGGPPLDTGKAAATIGSAQKPAPQPPAQSPTPTRAQSLFGDVNPKLAQLTDDVLFGDVWNRPGLSKRDRSLVTVSALIAMNRPDQLRSHLALALTNGVTREELIEVTTHLAFYAGWPSGVTAAGVAKEVFAAAPAATPAPQSPPLAIQEQGSFAAGGTVVRSPGTFDPLKPTPDGQTLHGDHARVFYQVPVNARKLPLVMWHGFGQFSKTWETTPDGREGFQNLFLRRRFSVYLIDQPRRGAAGRGTIGTTISAAPDEQRWFNTFRLGTWPNFFPEVQFSRKPEALEQFFRQMVPDTGPIDAKVAAKAASALFDKIGPGILVTHSHSGGFGWRTAISNKNIQAIVSYEPGSGFVFPEGEVPKPMPSSAGDLEAVGVPLSEFMALTKIPIVIYYGDNIPAEPSKNPGQDQWRVRLAMARLWAEAVNRRGGKVTVVHLPDVGIRGNTHFPFSDLNNVQIADLMSKYLSEKKMD